MITLDFPFDQMIEYKYLVKEGNKIEWENRSNRVLLTNQSRIFINDQWVNKRELKSFFEPLFLKNSELFCEPNRVKGIFDQPSLTKVMSFNVRYQNNEDGMNSW